MTKDPAVSHLTSHLGYLLRCVSNHVSHTFARKLEAANVTVAEWVVLRELYGETALAPSRLSERLGLTRGAVSKLADRLIEKAFIGRQASTEDGRAHTIQLTAMGRRLVPKLSALADQNDAEFFGDLNAEDRRTMERVLKSLMERHALKSVPMT